MNREPTTADTSAVSSKPNLVNEPVSNHPNLTSQAAVPPDTTGAAAAVGGAALGALAGAVGGPVGALVGAIAGGVGGSYVGRALAERADPKVENDYWRKEYSNRPYHSPERSYEEYEAAYRAGWEAFDPENAGEWSDREELARQRWEAEGGPPTMSWEEARAASEDAYYRVHKRLPK